MQEKALLELTYMPYLLKLLSKYIFISQKEN